MVDNTWRPEYGPDPLAGPDPLEGLDPFEVETREPFEVEPRDPLAGPDPFEIEPRDPLIVPSRRLRQHPTTSNIRIRNAQNAAGPAPQLAQQPPAYRRWRPHYHMMAPQGWMNDPCGPMFDEQAGVYHVAFQWVPTQVEWSSDICWGHAISKDMVSWEVVPKPILSPQLHSPPKGIFSGCMLRLDQPLVAFYTSNSGEVHYTKPYTRGVEALSAATSADNGQTWKLGDKDPLLPGPPGDVDVTGWRDPYVSKWPAMDVKRQSSADVFYGVISGGIRDVGGCLFLYTFCQSNPFKWDFVDQIGPIKLDYPPSRWSPDLGANWEVGNFVTLGDKSSSTQKECILIGVEGGKNIDGDRNAASCRSARRPHWLFGDIEVRGTGSGQKVDFKPGATGLFDYGSLYSINTFWNSKHQVHVAWGWVTEEDLTPALTKQQGWSGLLCMPREIFLLTLHDVTGALVSALQDITSIETIAQGSQKDRFVVQTLGQRPARDLETLRIPEAAFDLCHQGPVDLEPLMTSSFSSRASAPVQTESFSLKATLELGSDCSEIGFAVFQGDLARPLQTRVAFLPKEEKMVIHRPTSAVDPTVNSLPDVAPHTLFYTATDREAGPKLEKLTFEVFFDVSVLEVVANERTSLTTRLYPETNKVHGVIFYANDKKGGGAGTSKMTSCLAWDGLAASSMVLDRQHSKLYP